MRYYGILSYPHGGWAITGLTVSSICALGATMYGMASCRMFYIDYMTDRGDFGDFYRDPTADGDPVLQRVGAGLFSWLVPSNEDRNGDERLDWTDGQCAGFSQSQREFFSDIIFEVSRIFAIIAVLGGMFVVLSIFLLSCMAMRRFQIWMLSLVLFGITALTGSTFLVLMSQLCNDLVSYQDENYTTECTIDQGGLVIIAAAIFWAVAFLISVVYIKDPKRDLGIRDGQITNKFDTRAEERLRREAERRVKKEQKKQQGNQKKRGKPEQADVEEGSF
mmetsp:Transcript_13918/g.28714  ORF Transcript_13918/g.28714 Transcript_13918/m.28714 type:complete len:277 (-) Transcript_13918:125-955(-)